MIYSNNIHFSVKGISFTDKQGNKLAIGDAFKKAFVRFCNWGLDFKLMLLRWVGYIPSHSFRNFFYRVAGIKIGKGTYIHIHATFYQPKNIKIGEDSTLGDHLFMDGRDSLVIGNHVDIASEVRIYNSEHDIDSETFKARQGPVEIGDYVFIGPRVIILPGVKIGKGAVVGAGAVVTHDVPDFKIVGGVPAKEIGERKNKDLKYKLGRARLFQ